MGIYEEKETKSKSGKRTSLFMSENFGKKSQKPHLGFEKEEKKNSNLSQSSYGVMGLMQKYKPHIHYNSSEPEKLGAKAFAKNREIYLASRQEALLNHELAHVYQQKTKNIPITKEIGMQKVNLDSQLEREADKIAENIEEYMPAIVSEEAEYSNSGVVQFAPMDDEELKRRILEEAKKMGISHAIIAQELDTIITEFQEKDSAGWINEIKYFLWPPEWSDYLRFNSTKYIREILRNLNKNNVTNKKEEDLYTKLEESKVQDPSSLEGEIENKRIIEIMDMLSTEKILKLYSSRSNNIPDTLHNALLKMEDKQIDKLESCILELKNYCDSEGIKSVLQGANDIGFTVMDFDGEEDEKQRRNNYFIKRLQLMTSYIKDVAKKTDATGTELKEKYWIRSTGSDLHEDGQHALFLINKKNQQKEMNRVYKPHDLEADDVVIGIQGILGEINEIMKNSKIKGEAFATMGIDTKHHLEEFVIKKSIMTQDEAKQYFFKAGMLKVITDVMAVGDLHEDNIMPIKKGETVAPMIIDAEVNFFDYGNSCLEDGLSKDTVNGKITNASFEIKDIKKRSGEVFKDSELDYQKQYKAGYKFMIEYMNKSQDQFSKIYESQLKKVKKVRIVPLATKDFQGVLNSLMDDDSSEKRANLAKDLTELIEDNLRNKNYIFKKENNMEFNKEKMKNAIESTFENGTIPKLCVDMETGKILLDKMKIGEIGSIDSQYKKDELINVMVKCFDNKVEELYNRQS